MRIVNCAPQPRRLPASCCIVEVVNGGFGLSVRGDSSIDLTVNFKPDNESESFFASTSPRSNTWFALFSFKAPLLSKSFVVATR